MKVICNKAQSGECINRACNAGRKHEKEEECSGHFCSIVTNYVACIPVESEKKDAETEKWEETVILTSEENCHNTLEERLEEQAEASFKAGIKEVVEWIEENAYPPAAFKILDDSDMMTGNLSSRSGECSRSRDIKEALE